MSVLFSRGFDKKPNKGLFMSFEQSDTEYKGEVTVSDPPVKINLDTQQESIVNSTDNNIVVVAGAGSGKTRVLTERIRHLVKDLKVVPHNIVAITFTNMAAEEMKLRLSDIDTIGDAFIGTIHSFANRIMKESGEKYTLFNDELDIQLHRELINKYCDNLTIERYLEYKDLKSEVEMGKANDNALISFFTPSEQSDFNMLHYPCEVVNKDIENNTHLTFGESIKTLCKKRGIITFDELLVKAKDYFEKINAKVEYVFVDEFQDVGTLEYNFIKSLNSDNYFFVGDDYQSIYGFKGGNVRIFKSLVNDSNFHTYYLTNNYRNGTEILKLAEYVISQVDNRIVKEITPIVSESGEYSIQNRGSVNDVLFTLKNEKSYREWFILVRTNKELYDIALKCQKIGIPYTTFKREGMSLSQLNKEMRSNRVKLLTVHTSKGLEVDNVIMYGNFPVSVPYYRKNDEERKVMYVRITRARKRLIVLN